MRLGALTLALACVAACSGPGAEDAGTDAAVSADAGADAEAPPLLPAEIGPAERPAALVAPAAHDGVTPLPAVILLHGYGANGSGQDLYFQLSRAARTAGFYVVIPDGTPDAGGSRFWNATPWCCDFGGVGVDDVAYLTALMDALEAVAPVSHFFFVGHSNGGFMSYRMACERSDRVSAIVSLAGSDFLGDDECAPDRAVSVLQIHGDADATILYGGFAGRYPPAADVVQRWAARAGCDTGAGEAGERLDLDNGLAGEDTDTLRYASGCAGAEAELWTIRFGAHIPALTRAFSPTILEWLRAHAR